MNPNDRWTRGKSDKKYIYTVRQIAKDAGRTLRSIRTDIHNNKVSISNLSSVCSYIAFHKSIKRIAKYINKPIKSVMWDITKEKIDLSDPISTYQYIISKTKKC